MASSKQVSTKREQLKNALTGARYSLQDIAGEMGWAFSRQNYIPYALHQERMGQKRRNEERRYLHYLKRQKLIDAKKIGHQLHVRLTEKGWREALRDRIRTTKSLCKHGQCFVLFDIPERERVVRVMLRRFLKECGFKHLQHSVWMTDRDVIEPLRELLQRKKLEQWIRIIHGTIIPASPMERLTLRKKFSS